MRYVSTGKQVLCDGRHFADAADVTAADQIVDAMNRLDEAERDEATADMFAHPGSYNDPRLYIGHHSIRQENDEYACSCGARWDVAEGNDHP